MRDGFPQGWVLLRFAYDQIKQPGLPAEVVCIRRLSGSPATGADKFPHRRSQDVESNSPWQRLLQYTSSDFPAQHGVADPLLGKWIDG